MATPTTGAHDQDEVDHSCRQQRRKLSFVTKGNEFAPSFAGRIAVACHADFATFVRKCELVMWSGIPSECLHSQPSEQAAAVCQGQHRHRLLFTQLGDLSELRMIALSDAAWGVRRNSELQGGYVILLMNKMALQGLWTNPTSSSTGDPSSFPGSAEVAQTPKPNGRDELVVMVKKEKASIQGMCLVANVRQSATCHLKPLSWGVCLTI